MRDIKCKKCGSIYDKKFKKCPYCGKKKPKTSLTILIVIMIIALIIVVNNGAYINNLINDKTKIIDGLQLEIITAEYNRNLITNILDTTEVHCQLEISNITNKEKSIDFDITAYVDNYQTSLSYIFDSKTINVQSLPAGKKCTQDIYITTDNSEWDKIELYYRIGENDYQKLFTIYSKDLE